jgi:hypothetical protein
MALPFKLSTQKHINERLQILSLLSKPSSVLCYPVENEYSPSSDTNSRLLFVPKYLPEVLDRFVLNYKYHQNLSIKKIPDIRLPAQH